MTYSDRGFIMIEVLLFLSLVRIIYIYLIIKGLLIEYPIEYVESNKFIRLFYLLIASIVGVKIPISYKNYLDISYGDKAPSHLLYVLNCTTGKIKEVVRYSQGTIDEDKFSLIKKIYLSRIGLRYKENK